MDKIWHRGVIKYIHKKRFAPKDSHADMFFYISGYCFFICSCQKVGSAFYDEQGEPQDDGRCGQSTTATTEENIAHVQRVMMDDRHLTVNQISNNVGISCE